MKKIIINILIVISCVFPMNVFALEDNTDIQIVYLGDGIYVETVIEESNITLFATQTKTGTKTNTYKNASGNVLYTLSVTGTFEYTGSSSKCTAASVSATSKDAAWKVGSKSASKTLNKAIANATMNHYYNGKLVQTVNASVTLSCSATGKLS